MYIYAVNHLNWLKASLAVKREVHNVQVDICDASQQRVLMPSPVMRCCSNMKRCYIFESMSNHKCKVFLGRTDSTLAWEV